MDDFAESPSAEGPETRPAEPATRPSTTAAVSSMPAIAADQPEDGEDKPRLMQATAAAQAALPEDPLSNAIQALKDKKAELKKAKVQLAKDLRNAERKKKRLRQRARQLTDEDLVQVLMLRKQARQHRDDGATEVTSPSGSAEPSAYDAAAAAPKT